MSVEQEILAKLEADEKDLNKFARAVVAKRITIVAVIAIVLQVLVSYHWITPDYSAHVTNWINDAIDGLAAISGILYAQKAVTPSVDPRNDTGEALIPTSRVQALVANAVSVANGENVEPVDSPDADAEPFDPDVPAVDPDSQAVEAPADDQLPVAEAAEQPEQQPQA